MSVRTYKVNVPVPSHETLEGINSMIDYLTGIGEVKHSSLRHLPVVIEFIWETDQTSSFEHGYRLCEVEEEVNQTLAAYGWEQLHRRWCRYEPVS